MKENEKAFLIVDVQNDFCPGGALAVKDGDKVIAPINKISEYARNNGWKIAVSRDWHPEVSEHFDIWPVHCVQNTKGAQFHSDLVTENAVVFSKGQSNKDNGYSPFEGVAENGEGLDKFLTNIKKLYVAGLATDYCVKAAVLDAIKREYETYLVLDAIKAVEVNKGDEVSAINLLSSKGAKLIYSEDIVR